MANPHSTLLEGPSVDAEKALDILLVPERELRENGHHVYLDRREAVLWVFDLSMLAVEHEKNDQESTEVVKMLESYGCKSAYFVLLLSKSDIYRTVLWLSSSVRSRD